MQICPISIAVGCEKCPAFKLCPLKGILGDYKDVICEDGKKSRVPLTPKESQDTEKDI